MTHYRSARRLLPTALGLALMAGSGAAEAGWTVTPLKQSVPGYFFPLGIDDAGQVLAGLITTGNPNVEVVLATPTSFHFVHPCGATPTVGVLPVALDSSGRSVGQCGTDIYLAKGKTSFLFPAPQSSGEGPTLVGKGGPLIVGNTYQLDPVTGGNQAIGFLINTVTDAYLNFVVPDASATVLYGATNSGNTVFGTCLIAGVQHGFTHKIGFTFLDLPGYTKLTPTGANILGQVVGTVTDASHNTHAFVFQNGIFTLLQPPNEVDAIDVSINDKGQAVGVYLSQPDYTQHVFRWTPKTGAVTYFDVPFGNTGVTRLSINNKGDIAGAYTIGNVGTPFVAACSGTGC